MDLLIPEFYKEHFTHARHLEAQRTLISAASLGASGKLMFEIFSRFHSPADPIHQHGLYGLLLVRFSS